MPQWKPLNGAIPPSEKVGAKMQSAHGLLGPSNSDAIFRNDEQGVCPALVDLTFRARHLDYQGRGPAVCLITSKNLNGCFSMSALTFSDMPPVARSAGKSNADVHSSPLLLAIVAHAALAKRTRFSPLTSPACCKTQVATRLDQPARNSLLHSESTVSWVHSVRKQHCGSGPSPQGLAWEHRVRNPIFLCPKHEFQWPPSRCTPLARRTRLALLTTLHRFQPLQDPEPVERQHGREDTKIKETLENKSVLE